MATEKFDEDKFRDGLRDVAAVIEKLKVCYDSLDEVQKSCELAVENEVHFRLLVNLMIPKGKR